MKKLVPLKEFKYEVGPLSLVVEHFISSEYKNIVEFYIGGKSIWSNTYSTYFQAEVKFLIIKNILKSLKAKFSDLKPEDINPLKVKEISKDFLIEFKKIK